jgi:hypothetical protein
VSDTIGTNVGQGSAYVFALAGGVWTEQQKLTVATGSSGGSFGTSVAVLGNRVLVGGIGNDLQTGFGYFYTRNGAVWTLEQQVVASNGTATARFGSSVALSGMTALIGAYRGSVPGIGPVGSAYVFTLANGLWTESQTLVASDCASGDQFGYSVALSSNMAIVGASSDKIGTNVGQGSAYIFTFAGGIWKETSKLTASDGAANDGFGLSVDIDGNTAIAGAYKDDIGAATDRGSAYVFSFGKSSGDTCSFATECASGYCTDGVCCNNACGNGSTSDCQACSIAAGAPSDGTCDAVPVGTVCRNSAGVCDAAETCTGVSLSCPSDAKTMAGTECRASVGACDSHEVCDGSANDCPMDNKLAAGTECRASAGVCDSAESCDGSANDCPIDNKLAAGTECRASAGVCDVADVCNGTTNDCIDAKIASGTECRASAGVCDSAESCDGSATDCPVDANAADGTTCDHGSCVAGTCVGQGGAGGETGSSSSSSSTGGSEPPVESGCACSTLGSSSRNSDFATLGLLGVAFLVARQRARRSSIAMALVK